MTEDSASPPPAKDIWMLEELHKMRAYAEIKGMWHSQEALRIAIIYTAVDLGTATGLNAMELSRGLTLMPRPS